MKAYLDFAATCFIRKEALEAYLEVNSQSWGNPSSIHEAGYKAARVLAKARESVLSSLKLSKTHDCLFLSGASEANNLAIKGTSLAFNSRGDKVIYGAGEHPSVIESCKSLSRLGISALPIPLRDGAPDQLEAGKMISGAILCAVMAVNNSCRFCFFKDLKIRYRILDAVFDPVQIDRFKTVYTMRFNTSFIGFKKNIGADFRILSRYSVTYESVCHEIRNGFPIHNVSFCHFFFLLDFV